MGPAIALLCNKMRTSWYNTRQGKKKFKSDKPKN